MRVCLRVKFRPLRSCHALFLDRLFPLCPLSASRNFYVLTEKRGAPLAANAACHRHLQHCIQFSGCAARLQILFAASCRFASIQRAAFLCPWPQSCNYCLQTVAAFAAPQSATRLSFLIRNFLATIDLIALRADPAMLLFALLETGASASATSRSTT